MERLSIRKIIFTILSLLIITFFAISFLSLNGYGSDNGYAANEQKTEIAENIVIQNTYDLYDFFKAPESELLIGGENQKADSCEVTTPSGMVANGFKGFTVSEYGKFTVKYSKNVDGTEYYGTKEFYVYEDAYTTGSVRSTCEYQDQIAMSDEAESGLHVKIETYRGFYYNRPIPVSSLTGRGDFITFYPYVEDYFKTYSDLVGETPDSNNPQNGATVAQTRPFEIVFKLTDSEDSDNYVTVTYTIFVSNTKLDGKVYAVYYRASANNQNLRGWTQNDSASNTTTSKAIVYNGKRYSVWDNDNYGTVGFYHGPTMNNRPCTFGFNATTTEVTASENSSKYTGEKLVNALNNYDIYEDNAFEGFKGDNVYLSIWVNGPYFTLNPYIEFDITQIGPYSGEDLKTDKNIDKTAPVIRVDYTSDSVNVAKDAKFYPFDYTVSDASKIATKEVRVYRLIDNQKTYVATAEDYFVPSELGEYYLEYYAEDVYGNHSTKTVKLNCKFNNGRGIAFFSTKLSDVVFGEKVTLPSYSISSLNNCKLEVTITSPKGNIEIASDDTFVPNCIGTYTIKYHYYDEAYSYDTSYDFEVVKSNNCIIYEEPNYGVQYIKDKYYALDKVYAIIGNDVESIKAAVTYAFEDGETDISKAKKIENGKDYLCEAENSVRFKVVYNDGVADNVLYESEDIPVISAHENNEFKLENYFATDGCTVKLESSKTLFDFDGSKKTVKIDFIGNLLLSNFNFNFRVPAGKSNFKTLTVRVTDLYDETKYFDVIYTLYSGYYTCSLNDLFVKSHIYDFSDNLYEIGYSNGVVSILNHDKIRCNFDPDFSKDKAKVSVIIDGITDAGELEIQSINKVEMSLNTNDVNVKPALGVLNLPSYIAKGEKAVIPFADVSDLLNATINERIELTIVAPDGTKLVSNYVMTEDYELICDQTGNYEIEISIFTQSVAYDTFSYYVNCQNMTPPTVTLKGQSAGDEVIYTKNGVEVSIADYETDDDTTVTVYYKDTCGTIRKVTDGKITLDDVGTYTIYYHAINSDNVLTLIDYTIRVVG